MAESPRPFLHLGSRLDSRFSFIGDSVKDESVVDDPVHHAVTKEDWYQVSPVPLQIKLIFVCAIFCAKILAEDANTDKLAYWTSIVTLHCQPFLSY